MEKPCLITTILEEIDSFCSIADYGQERLQELSEQIHSIENKLLQYLGNAKLLAKFHQELRYAQAALQSTQSALSQWQVKIFKAEQILAEKKDSLLFDFVQQSKKIAELQKKLADQVEFSVSYEEKCAALFQNLAKARQKQTQRVEMLKV